MDDDHTVEFSENYLTDEGYQNFLSILSVAGLFNDRSLTRMAYQNSRNIQSQMKRFTTSVVSEVGAPAGPCVPGKMRYMVNSEGTFYPCERVDELSECMKIGTIEQGFDIKKIESLINVAQLTGEECKNCWCFSQCNVCAKKADKNGELSRTEKLKACYEAKSNAEYGIRMKILLHELEQHKAWKVRKDYA